MRGIIKKWGNSAAVRLPAPLLKSLDLGLEDQVLIRVEDGNIVLEPVRQAAPALHSLLQDVQPQNLHAEIDFGTPGG